MSIFVMCDKDAPGAYESKGWGTEVWVRSLPEAEGRVLQLSEMNGYDDSDFFATYWSDEKNAPVKYMYATTRGWSYPCNAVVDATPEVVAKYEAWVKARYEEEAARKEAARLAIPLKGRKVECLSKRGKAAPAYGKVGEVFWYGKNGFSPEMRVGVVLPSGEKYFLAAHMVKVVYPEKEAA